MSDPSTEFRRFLYFIPGGERPTAETLRALGLGHLVADRRPWTPRHSGRGPAGEPGHVVSLDAPHGRPAAEAGYLPSQGQTWVPCASRAWWLGWYADALPRPEDLLRPDPLRGHLVELGDGHFWLVPVALRVDLADQRYSFVLPQAMDLDEEGNWTTEPLAEVEGFATRIEKVWREYLAYCQAPDQCEIDGMRWLNTAVEGLALNYCVSRWEVAKRALGLLTNRNIEGIIAALLDIPTLLDHAQQQDVEGKAEAAASPGSDTDCGAAADSHPDGGDGGAPISR